MSDMPEQIRDVASTAARPSRQSLVVPQPHSNLPLVLGALLCGCLGFGFVWTVGSLFGRRPEPATIGGDDAAAAHAPAADHAPREPHEPARLDLPVETLRHAADAGDDHWRTSTRRSDRSVDDTDGPPVRPASLELASGARLTSGEGSPAARFSRTDLPPPDPVADPAPADDAPPAAAPGRFNPPAATDIASPGPAAEPALTPEPTPDAPNADDEARAVETAPVAEPAAEPQPPTQPRAAQAPPPDAAPAPHPFAAAPAIVPPAQTQPAPWGNGPVPPPLPPARQPGFAGSPPPSQRSLPPPPPAPPVGLVPQPYAAAPPLAVGAAMPGGMPSARPVDPAVAGDGPGRPGPMQLEGVQSPQLSVEKRGPREVQVGKPARYEILVRNGGGVPARDVLLRDAVPQGTALIATSPPATPVVAAGGQAAGELLWQLGELAPGAQARIVMEVMPQVEGEIGSVASVSFRADASVRSRSTKPDLQIEVSQPAPVRIGGDMQLSVRVANPGSGIATGVVLEGLLPENVSHRAGRELEFDVGQLKPGESRTIDLVLGSRGPGVHQARFAARADGGIEVERPVRLEVTAPTLDVAIDMPVRRFLQRQVTCTISMINAGTAPARAVELAAQLPPGMKFVKANNAGWHDERTHRVLWNLEELPAGETGIVEMVLMPVALGPQKIAAAARSTDGVAHQVAHTCEVEGLASLFFEVADSEDPIEVDGSTEYVIKVGNQGTKPATGVRISAALLGDLEPVDARGPVQHRVEARGIAFEPLAKLAPSEEAVFRIRVRGRRAGDQRVQVQAVSEDHPTPITKEEITRVYDDR
jgi:uncharacterized repeat protein (TIGR01451 family)